jgi:hypothetical protein
MKLRIPLVLLALVATLAAFPALAAKEVTTPVQPPVWAGHPNAEQVTKQVDERIAKAKTLVAKMLAVKGERTVANTLRRCTPIRCCARPPKRRAARCRPTAPSCR